jgi:large subunit ribosomal protein L24
MAKIKKGDDVVVLTGKDKGKRGKIIAVLGDRVRVEGINLVKKHVKPNPMTQQPGGIVDREATIHASNVAVFNTATGKADRVGYKFEDGKKVRVFKSNGARIDA